MATPDLVLTSDLPGYPKGTVMVWDGLTEVYLSPAKRLKITRDFVEQRPEDVRLADVKGGVTYYEVDAKGNVTLRLARSGLWLVKAVHMAAAPPDAGVDWESWWASLTFELGSVPRK